MVDNKNSKLRSIIRLSLFGLFGQVFARQGYKKPLIITLYLISVVSFLYGIVSIVLYFRGHISPNVFIYGIMLLVLSLVLSTIAIIYTVWCILKKPAPK